MASSVVADLEFNSMLADLHNNVIDMDELYRDEVVSEPFFLEDVVDLSHCDLSSFFLEPNGNDVPSEAEEEEEKKKDLQPFSAEKVSWITPDVNNNNVCEVQISLPQEPVPLQVLLHLQQQQQQEQEQQRPPAPSLLRCPECQKTFPEDTAHFRKHFRDIHEVRGCVDCAGSFVGYQRLHAHRVKEHGHKPKKIRGRK